MSMTKIPLRGMSKQRPRMSKNGIFMNKAYKEWQKDFKSFYEALYPHRKEFYNEPIQVKILFQFKIPKSYTKKQKANPDHTRITQDIDNLAGGVMDSLNGVAYKDDKQIISLLVDKRFGDEDCVYLEIST